MAATASAKQRRTRRSWPAAEKRRLVELTLREGASLLAIAREHDVNPNSLGQWKALYRAGKLNAPVKRTARVAAPVASATFMPVSVASEVRRPQQPATRPGTDSARNSIVQMVFATGATLRIETAVLDATLVCALVAELQR